MNDHDQALLDASMDGATCWDDPRPQVTAMPGLLPPGYACSAYWYAQRAGLLTGQGDLEFLRCLGLRAWHLARQYGVSLGPKVQEGPYWVWQYPEWILDIAAKQFAEDCARFGDVTYSQDPPEDFRQGSWDPGWPPMSSEDM